MKYLPILLGILPSFAWLVFYLQEDPHPEPKPLIFKTFLAGGISTIIVLSIQSLFNGIVEPLGIIQYSFFSFLGLSAIEELFKFFAAWTVIDQNPNDFDEPVDAMIYLIVAALGFAAIENIAAISRAADLAFETVTLRFIGATLLHTLSSGLLGYYWARSIIKDKKTILFTGFALAVLLHTVFNYLILIFEPAVIPTTFLITAALIILYDFEKLKHY